MTSSGLTSGQRWTRQHPCPICGGHQAISRGHGERCWGYVSDDGAIAFCTRSELSGELQPLLNAGGAYAHRMEGDCRCGRVHGSAPLAVTPRVARQRRPAEPALEPALLDAVYWRYLDLCPLRPEHERFYRERGERDLQAAVAYRFGSLPLGDTAAGRLVDALVGEFGTATVERVPGFWTGEHGIATHTGTRTSDAAVIPCWGLSGRIVGMVRHTTKGPAAKYRMFQGARGVYAYAADGLPDRIAQRRTGAAVGPDPACPQLWVTEGIRKAYVASLSGLAVFGMPGAYLSSHDLHLLRAINPTHVVLALDADKRTNADVVRAHNANLHRLRGGH